MKKINKNIKGIYYAKIRSRHPSHDVLRKHERLVFDRPVVIRFGSMTEMPEGYLEINKVEGVKNSASKLNMKRCFDAANCNHPRWFLPKKQDKQIKLFNEKEDNVYLVNDEENIKYPLVLKHIYGSRNKGNTIIYNSVDLNNKLKSIEEMGKLHNYIIEEYFSGMREYRLHVSKNGCFYTCRKVLKEDTPKENRWFKNDSNSSWILEENALFDKPINWNDIVQNCVIALSAIGLDTGAFDLRVQSAKDKKGKIRQNPKFQIIEINSAPSFGQITPEKYLNEILSLIHEKLQKNV